MFLMTGDAKYIDVLERTMYNNIIDGVSLSGDRFFYPNPLSSYGQHERREWFGCACCPPNVARFLPSMPGYIYAYEGESIYVNLYISSSSQFNLAGKTLTLSQSSQYPWEGATSITISAEQPSIAIINLRIPGYVQNQPVPSDLYTYHGVEQEGFIIKVNGKVQQVKLNPKGYVTLDRIWKNGDKIDIQFPFEPKVVRAHPNVLENKDKIAIERGPIVYCAEWPDNEAGEVLSLFLNPTSSFKAQRSDILNGIYTIKSKAKQAYRTLEGTVKETASRPLTLIPYYAWNNRGPGAMSIWLPTTLESTLPEPAPTIARKSQVSASKDSKAIIALNDQIHPAHSNDHSISYFHWWPNKDQQEWVQFDFDATTTISSVKVYWFDDGPHGGCRIPASWTVQYRSGEDWKSVNNSSPYSVTKDDWDQVTFDPVKADGLKLLIQLPKDYATGLYEVIIE